jgi:RNase P/RNase MRP subunit p29
MIIGKTITITDAKNRSLIGKGGMVLDETKNTITIKTQNKDVTIIKDQLITIEETP